MSENMTVSVALNQRDHARLEELKTKLEHDTSDTLRILIRQECERQGIEVQAEAEPAAE